jgi:L-cysteine:1D-myo-inositol 2-amino-2-deoxy-alpha-D-glucopyranoside ligase
MSAASWVSGSVGAGDHAGAREPLPPTLVLAGVRLPVVGPLRAYTCGITPYDVTHVGHASVFVWADLLRSVARGVLGTGTTMCRNVTDVDDVLTRAASARGEYYDEFAVTHEFRFDRDMRGLAVASPDSSPRAHRHVGDVVRLAAALLDSGHAYERDGQVFFRGAGVAEAAGVAPAEARRRSEEFGDVQDDGREDPADVPVWRSSGAEDPAWPSPWGWGRPGWHAECAAMALVALGGRVDVLIGGADLAFPHHAYQQAMVEAVVGGGFARSTLHVGTVSHAGAKMAKSTGNLVLVGDLLERYPAAVLRLALLDRPWAEPWEFTEDVLVGAAATLEAVYAAAGRPGGSGQDGLVGVRAALLDDLDVPAALGVAREAGGDAARFLLDVLKLGSATS